MFPITVAVAVAVAVTVAVVALNVFVDFQTHKFAVHLDVCIEDMQSCIASQEVDLI